MAKGLLVVLACLLFAALSAEGKTQPRLQKFRFVEQDPPAPETDWGPCSKTCGDGIQVDEKNPQNTRACRVMNCPAAAWSSFGECSVTCGKGVRTRTCNKHEDSQTCEGESTEDCELAACPVVDTAGTSSTSSSTTTDSAPAAVAEAPALKCSEGSWIAVAPCSTLCGAGTQTFKLYYEDGSDAACPVVEKTVACNSHPCPIHCEMSKWTPAGACSAPCGTGKQRWVRDVVTLPNYGGRPCGEKIQFLSCNTMPCSRDAEVTDWKPCPNSACSAHCGPGKQKFCREVSVKDEHDGRPAGPIEEERECNLGPCRVHCEEGPWEAAGPCSKSCGGGEQTFTRTPKTPANEFGTQCGPSEEVRSCNANVPCPIDCEYNDWVAEETCSKPCGTGERRFTRTVRTQNTANGRPCEHTEKKEPCNVFDCPINCLQSDWVAHGPCSVTCDAGTQEYVRTTEHEPNEYGRACSYHIDHRVCVMPPCTSTRDE